MIRENDLLRWQVSRLKEATWKREAQTTRDTDKVMKLAKEAKSNKDRNEEMRAKLKKIQEQLGEVKTKRDTIQWICDSATHENMDDPAVLVSMIRWTIEPKKEEPENVDCPFEFNGSDVDEHSPIKQENELEQYFDDASEVFAS